MAKTLALAFVCVAAGSAVPPLALGLLGVVVGTVSLPTWLVANPVLLRIVIWIAPVLLCAYLVARLTRRNAFRFGLLAGVSASICLLAIAVTSEYSQGDAIAPLAKFLLPELSLLLLFLPLISALWVRRAA